MHRTNAQRRRTAKEAQRLARRRAPGQRASEASLKAVVAYDPNAARKALDADLEHAGMAWIDR